MAELEMAPSGCCTTEQRVECCEPDEKAECCEPGRDGCGCQRPRREPEPTGHVGRD
jgi:hypothetical protein